MSSPLHRLPTTFEEALLDGRRHDVLLSGGSRHTPLKSLQSQPVLVPVATL